MRNAIFTVGLVQFFFIWNDLLIALTFTTRPELATIQVGLLNFTDEYGSTQYGPLFAAISINIVVLLVRLRLPQQEDHGRHGCRFSQGIGARMSSRSANRTSCTPVRW